MSRISPALSLAIAASLLAGSIPAAEERTPTSPAIFELGTLTVHGEAPEAADRTPVQIEFDTIDLSNKTDLSGALSLLPGVTLTRFGGRNEAAVSIRGFARTQTPLFVDGVPVYVPYDGIVDFGRFTTFDVAAVRLDKGYSSALLGPNTMGGAINVITRQPSRPFEGQLSAGLFSGEGRQGSLNVGSRQKHWYFQAGASYTTQDYYPLSGHFTPVPVEDGGHRDNSYRTDWKLSGKVAYVPNTTDEYAVGIIHQDGEKGTPPQTTAARYWQWPQWDKQTVYYVSQTRLGDASYVKPRLYYDTYDNVLGVFDDATYSAQKKAASVTTIYHDYTYGGSVEAGAKLGARNRLKGVLHYKFDHHREFPDSTRKPTVSYVDEDAGISYGVEDTLRLAPRWSAQAGLSYDTRKTEKAIDSTTGLAFASKHFSSFNPEAGVFYELADTGVLHATVAHKSRFPSMKERYTYRMGQGIPNPGLEAEKAMHYEVGYVGRLGPKLSLNMSVYFSRVENTIQSVFLTPTSPVSQFQNLGTSENRGVDLGIDWTLSPRATLRASYSYIHQQSLTILPRNTEPVKVTDTPPHSGSLHADLRPLKWLSVVPGLDFSSWRYSVADGRGTTRKVGGFTLFHVRLAVRLSQGVELGAGVENLFDKNYVFQEGYPEMGRTWFGSARYRF
jgi:iron complex outermembrane receptor protein